MIQWKLLCSFECEMVFYDEATYSDRSVMIDRINCRVLKTAGKIQVVEIVSNMIDKILQARKFTF